MCMKFGEAIKDRREQMGMTQQDLAEKLFVSRQTVCRWENGSRCPDLVMSKKIALVLGISLDELISDEAVRDYVPDRESTLDISCVKVMLTGIILILVGIFLYMASDGNMDGFSVFCFFAGILVFALGLFIPWEKGKTVVNDRLPQRKCPKCGKEHDFDYPQCPHCDYSYQK